MRFDLSQQSMRRVVEVPEGYYVYLIYISPVTSKWSLKVESTELHPTRAEAMEQMEILNEFDKSEGEAIIRQAGRAAELELALA